MKTESHNLQTTHLSISFPPPVAATVPGAPEVIENEPWLRRQLPDTVEYAIKKLKPFGLYIPPQAAIIALALPEKTDIRKSACLFHEKGISLNPVKYYGVPAGKQCFCNNPVATHTNNDKNKLTTAVEKVRNITKAYSQ